MNKTYCFYGVNTKTFWTVNPKQETRYNRCPECGSTFFHDFGCNNRLHYFEENIAGVISNTSITEKMILLYTEISNYDYKVGEQILINGKYVTIESLVREPQTGHYHVQTGFVVEHRNDMESKEKAEKDLIEYKETQKSLRNEIVEWEKNVTSKRVDMVKKSDIESQKVSNENSIAGGIIGGLVFLCITLGFLLMLR